MKIAQKSFFNKYYVGSTKKSGVSFPDFKKISQTFDFTYFRINNNKDILEKLSHIMKHKQKLICEINVSDDFKMNPLFSTKIINGKKIQPTLDDMEPFLKNNEKV